MHKKLLTGLTIAILAAVLVPSVAFAGSLTTGSVLGADGQPALAQLETQAEKTTVYVLTKFGDDLMRYNKNGLVTKRSKGFLGTWTYRYSGTKISSIKVSNNSGSTRSITLSYDKKGRLKVVDSNGAASYDAYKETYEYDAKGRVKNSKKVSTIDGTTTTAKYAYDSKGRLKKVVTSENELQEFSYDSRGNNSIAHFGPANGAGFNRYFMFKYRYKNGHPIERSQTMNGAGGGKAYKDKLKYKRIRIPKKYVAQVKMQQRVLLGNPNPAIIL